jgi:hypothetical protein
MATVSITPDQDIVLAETHIDAPASSWNLRARLTLFALRDRVGIFISVATSHSRPKSCQAPRNPAFLLTHCPRSKYNFVEPVPFTLRNSI